eukprot:TRINITY_DN21743_c0_g1_i2.p1 TRINITY_DN21743_c0_g1~~TRINITY_DN21743_c0_g1_i2.p1  ORF type:complete len:276 (+),score=66.26 TRINITY_DN21743_c0_g1_i2:150-977(+)
MIRRPPRSTLSSSSAASDVYKRQVSTQSTGSTRIPHAIMASGRLTPPEVALAQASNGIDELDARIQQLETKLMEATPRRSSKKRGDRKHRDPTPEILQAMVNQAVTQRMEQGGYNEAGLEEGSGHQLERRGPESAEAVTVATLERLIGLLLYHWGRAKHPNLNRLHTMVNHHQKQAAEHAAAVGESAVQREIDVCVAGLASAESVNRHISELRDGLTTQYQELKRQIDKLHERVGAVERPVQQLTISVAEANEIKASRNQLYTCLLYTSPSPRDS